MTKSKPVIGISGNERPHAKFPDIMWSYTPSGYVRGVQEAGGLPLVLPISAPEFAASYVSMIDKLILTGGQNVDPVFYGEEKDTTDDDFYLERDLFEFALVDEMMKQRKPIFSVCRGTQLMNIALGGTLHQDIENHWQDEPTDYLSQNMLVKPNTALEKIYGTSTAINSFHHQSINRLADDLEVIAYDPADDTVEAVVSTRSDLTFLGVQWHPELLLQSRKEDQDLFYYVVHEL